MHIFIIGPTASGKTTIGKKLAQLLNMNFIDTDKEIEKSTGDLVLYNSDATVESLIFGIGTIIPVYLIY